MTADGSLRPGRLLPRRAFLAANRAFPARDCRLRTLTAGRSTVRAPADASKRRMKNTLSARTAVFMTVVLGGRDDRCRRHAARRDGRGRRDRAAARSHGQEAGADFGRGNRSAAGADRALPRPAPRADSDVRVRPGEGRRAQRLAEEERDAQGHAAPGRGRQGRLRTELRRARPLPRHRQHDGGAEGLDDPARTGVRRRPVGGLRQHSTAARAGAEGRQPEGHAAAGSRDEDHLRRRDR